MISNEEFFSSMKATDEEEDIPEETSVNSSASIVMGLDEKLAKRLSG
jgi:hypothetical protein